MHRPQTSPTAAIVTSPPFVTRGPKKPSPMRHKIPDSPCNHHKINHLTRDKINHTHPAKTASPSSPAREARGPEKTLPTRLPISNHPSNTNKHNLLDRHKKIRTNPKSSPLPLDPTPPSQRSKSTHPHQPVQPCKTCRFPLTRPALAAKILPITGSSCTQSCNGGQVS